MVINDIEIRGILSPPQTSARTPPSSSHVLSQHFSASVTKCDRGPIYLYLTYLNYYQKNTRKLLRLCTRCYVSSLVWIESKLSEIFEVDEGGVLADVWGGDIDSIVLYVYIIVWNPRLGRRKLTEKSEISNSWTGIVWFCMKHSSISTHLSSHLLNQISNAAQSQGAITTGLYSQSLI